MCLPKRFTVFLISVSKSKNISIKKNKIKESVKINSLISKHFIEHKQNELNLEKEWKSYLKPEISAEPE